MEGLTRPGVLENINISLHQREILGIAGMVGSGRTELLRAIYGVDPWEEGKIFIREKK